MFRLASYAVVLAVAGTASRAPAATYAATPANFVQVFAAAQSGDRITLSGSFGAVTLADRNFLVPLALDATAATFSDTLLIRNVQGLTFTGGYYGSTTVLPSYGRDVAAYASSTISFTRAYVVGPQGGQGIQFIESTDVGVTASTFDGLRSGVGIVGTTGAVLDRNMSIRSVSDGFDIADSHGVTVSNSTCTGGTPEAGAHPDCVQLYSIAGHAPQSDIVITGNLAHGPTQGFTSFNPQDGGGVRIDISRNTVQTSYPQGVACYACVDSTFLSNHLTTLPGSAHRTNINIIGGSNNLAFGNTRDGAAAPDDTDPLSVVPIPADILADLDWRNSPLAGLGTSAAPGAYVANPPAATVPDISSWAAMITGFAAIGTRLRGRRRATA